MNRFSTHSKLNVVSTALAVVASIALAGCYEGYKKPNQGQQGGEQKGGGGGGSKPFGFALIDVVKPNAEALVSPRCGRVPTSLAAVRMAEVEKRLRGVSDVVTGLSDMTAVQVLDVDSANCESFGSVQALARRTLPDGNIPADLKAKPALHIRLVLWFGDTSREYPAPVLTNNEWASFQKLGRDGFNRRLSVNHFALTGPVYGYVWSWKNLSDPNLNFLATTLNNPSPTNEGMTELMNAVLKSTMDFATWLRERSGTTL